VVPRHFRPYDESAFYLGGTFMNYLLYFGIIFIIIFLFYFLVLNRIKLKKQNYNKIGEINYLIKKFKLDPHKINYRLVANIVALINAFIIAFVCVVISLIDISFIWQMLIGFVLLFALIYALYEILGRILVKKGWGK
jgi:hypothetical protein